MDSIEEVVSREHSPTLHNVERYREYYAANPEYTLPFQAGILAAGFFVKEKKYDDACSLLTKILPVIRSVSGQEEYMRFFKKHIPFAEIILKNFEKEGNISATLLASILISSESVPEDL